MKRTPNQLPKEVKLMSTVQQILDDKGTEVLAIGPDDTVLEAISKMADNNVGSLVVLDGKKLVGIFSERNYARNVFLKGRSSPETLVRQIMSTHVVCVEPGQTVEECMAVMSDKRIRHLPVLDNNQMVGLVSIGDLVKNIIRDQKFVIDQLEHYISG
jgi:CBS domain-containing protein